jgi:hypothetical protein
MKLTTKQLRQIIREELEEAVRGGFSHDAMGSDPSRRSQAMSSVPTPNEASSQLFHTITEKLMDYDENAEWLVDILSEEIPQPQYLSPEQLIRDVSKLLEDNLGITIVLQGGEIGFREAE